MKKAHDLEMDMIEQFMTPYARKSLEKAMKGEGKYSVTTMSELRNKVKKFRPASQKVNVFNSTISGWSIRLYKFKDTNGNKFRIYFFGDRIILETPLATLLHFSINIPDKIGFADMFSENVSGIGKLFVSKLFVDDSKDKQIKSCVELLKKDLKSLCFDHCEGLTVYGNSLELILKSERQILPEIEICEKMKSIIESNFPEEIYSIDYSDLPTDLKTLIVKFESFAISDDYEREEKSKKITKKKRTELIEAVEGKLDDIDRFLDDFGGKPLTDGAIKLQCLAEMAMELKCGLEAGK